MPSGIAAVQRDLLSYRDEFDSVRNCRYLISNSLGAMPNRAATALADYAAAWKRRGVRAWEETWWMMSRQVGDRIASLIGAAPDSVSMHPNVTSASATVLSCFDVAPPRNKVVMVEMEFPSLQYLYHEWLRDAGHVRIVPCPDGIAVPTEHLLEAIDETTLLVPISHVLFLSSAIVDAKAVIERAHRVGALVVLDTFHSTGVLPFDVTELGVDFAVGGCLKWLCGGPGACFLYVRPDLALDLKPRLTGWMSHDNPFAFAQPPLRRSQGAYRFINGTPNIPALYACGPGLEIAAEIGPTAIRRRSMEMTARLYDLARSHGWTVMTPEDPSARAGTVSIDIPDASPVAAELTARDFLVDYRPGAGIRIAPHFYTTDDDIDAVIAEIASMLSDRSYERQATHQRVVT